MIIVKKEFIKNIPILEVVSEDKLRKRLPLIIFVHGITSAKEHNLHYAYLLAEKGFRVVLPEAIYHGERGGDLPGEKLYLHFWEIVLQSIHD